MGEMKWQGLWRCASLILLLFFLGSSVLRADNPAVVMRAQDPQDPLWRYRYFPSAFAQAIETSPLIGDRLQRLFVEQIQSYFAKDPQRLQQIPLEMSAWSALTYKNFWKNESFSPEQVSQRLAEPGALSAKEMATLSWAWVRDGLSELTRSNRKSDVLWLNEFFSSFETRAADAEELLRVDPRFYESVVVVLQEFYRSCLAEFGLGNRSKRFLALGEIFARYRSSSFQGVEWDWTDFENALQTQSFDDLDVGGLAFLMSLRRLEIETRLSDGIPWSRTHLDRLQSVIDENSSWGRWSEEDIQSAIRWSEPRMDELYRQRKKEEQVDRLSPLLWISEQPLAAMALGVGLLGREFSKAFRLLPNLRGPIPFDLLEHQMAANPPGTMAHEQARAQWQSQRRQLQEAQRYAEAKWGTSAGVESLLMSRAEAHRAGIVDRHSACAPVLREIALAGKSLLAARAASLRVVRSHPSLKRVGSAPSNREFFVQQYQAPWYRRWFQPKYWGMSKRLNRFGSQRSPIWFQNPGFAGGEFSAMIPGQILRLSLAESVLTRGAAAFSFVGGGVLLTQAALAGSDYLWGPREAKKVNGEVLDDPLWDQILLQRTSRADLKIKQTAELRAQIQTIEELWNPENLDLPENARPPKVRWVAHPQSASDPVFATGRVGSFYVALVQELETEDVLARFANRMNAIILRFESFSAEKGAIEWRITGRVDLERASAARRRQAVAAFRPTGESFEDFYIDPEMIEILFTGSNRDSSNR